MSRTITLQPAPHHSRIEERGGGMLVATRTTTVKDQDGNLEELVAGVTFVEARHWLVKTYPELFGPESDTHKYRAKRRPGRAARSTPKTALRPAAPRASTCPQVVLLDGSVPTVTVKLRDKARELIRDQGFRARDGDEVGGALYGEPHRSDLPAGLSVERACGPGPRSTREPARFMSDIGYYIANENRANGEHERSVRWIGDWHCHPEDQSGLPSPGDLTGWARALQMYGPERGLSHYVGLIVTAPHRTDNYSTRQDWNDPRLHAWVLCNTFERWVCKPARIEGW